MGNLGQLVRVTCEGLLRPLYKMLAKLRGIIREKVWGISRFRRMEKEDEVF